MKFSRYCTIIVSFFSYVVFGISCKENNDAPVENIYYYPEKNIYYDVLQSKYYYSLDSARTWDSMAFPSPGYGKALGSKIPIQRTGDNVWIDNESHRREYNGMLFNIVNNYTISLARADRINKLKAVVKIETRPKVVEKEQQPPEKGLKKFFNKLFGKKKKQDEEKKQ